MVDVGHAIRGFFTTLLEGRDPDDAARAATLWHALRMLSSPSSLLLVAVNLLPLGGVIFFDWSVFELLLLYWTESVVIGVINVLRMITSQGAHPLSGFAANPTTSAAAEATVAAGGRRPSERSLKFFLVPFFILHYGAFCFAHLAAVVTIFADDELLGRLGAAIPAPTDTTFWIVVAFIFLSHLFSFLSNFLGKGEFRRTGVATLMQRPYGRIIIMHVTVILGAALVDWLDNPLPMLLVLVIGKTFVDLKLHRRERERFGTLVLAQQP